MQLFYYLLVSLFYLILFLFCFFPTIFVFYVIFFFFSSRRRHTRCSRDWSSDVCSSDLADQGGLSVPRLDSCRAHCARPGFVSGPGAARGDARDPGMAEFLFQIADDGTRSEERRVGKECRSRWSPYH